MKKYLFFLFVPLLFSCKKQKKERTFDRYIIAATYNNNNQIKEDSLEMSTTICQVLVYVSKNADCYIYKRTDKDPLFYKCKTSPEETNLFMDSLESLKQQFPQKYTYKHHYCASDINLILENDSQTDYHFIQTGKINSILKFVSAFIDRQTKNQVDSVETLLKYKYYVLSSVSYLVRQRYGFDPVNDLYNKGKSRFTPSEVH